jgi:predicted acylesterase/phospholipase RssA
VKVGLLRRGRRGGQRGKGVRDVVAGDYEAPRLECDVVMKGGITSGVVYPGAVLEIAKRYRFRSIGGASAGAIAAAVAAAAEFRRSVRAPGGVEGFARLAELPGAIAGTTPAGTPFVLSLFQADPPTRPLFEVVIGFLQHGLMGGAWSLLRRFPRFPVLAFLAGGGAVILACTSGARSGFAVAGVAGAVLILAVGLGSDVFGSVLALARNDFGLCRLGPDAGSEAEPALTAWLHGEIQATAGVTGDRPLTFADLWGIPPLPTHPTPEQLDEHRTAVIELSRNPRDRKLDLQMMTTSLTHGRPVRLPVPFQPHRPRLEDGGGLLFRPDELRHFLPPAVLDHVAELGGEPDGETRAHLEREQPGVDFRRFPIGPDLPVVVATRMSLSFPILISAFPLWELDYQKDAHEPPLRRVYFSDGGITSNFPVHFFDSPLPTRPTFGIHLAGFEPDEHPDPADPSRAVDDPAPVNGAARESWVEFDSVFGFLVAIKDAAQNWRDNTQSRLPGFRERIVHIKLDRGEGGLNLAMKRAKIDELTGRGVLAGDRLVTLFACREPEEPDGCRWNDHRFARYRTTMALLERFLRQLARGYGSPADEVTVPYPERVVEGGARAPFRFRDDALLAFAQSTTGAYLDLVAGWEADGLSLDDPRVPRPPSTLRAVPPV